jgi:hypothetical protein
MVKLLNYVQYLFRQFNLENEGPQHGNYARFSFVFQSDNGDRWNQDYEILYEDRDTNLHMK